MTWCPAPWGSQILPAPELSEVQRDKIEERIKNRRGGLALVEAVKPPPSGDWDAKNVTPDIRPMDLDKHWMSVRDTIMGAYGIPPILFSAGAQSAALREAQRHAVLWTLAPIAKVASAEIGRKLDDRDFSLDLVTPLQAADSAGRARAVGILVGNGMALDGALALVGWGQQSS